MGDPYKSAHGAKPDCAARVGACVVGAGGGIVILDRDGQRHDTGGMETDVEAALGENEVAVIVDVKYRARRHRQVDCSFVAFGYLLAMHLLAQNIEPPQCAGGRLE